jgi:hypothetical protein
MKAANSSSCLFLALFSLTLCGGCVTTTVTKDEPRTSVHFASADAASIFYNAYIVQNYTRIGATGRTLEIGIDARLPYHHAEYRTDNVLFNAAIATADSNHDGMISDDEAKRFSEKVRQTSPLKPSDSGFVMVAKQ